MTTLKRLIWIICVVALLAGCSSGVSQEEYDRVVSERDALQSQLDAISQSVKAEPSLSEEPRQEISPIIEILSESETSAEELSYGANFDFDGFEITIGDAIEWGVISNQFSENNGMDVAKLPIKLKNLGEETGSLNTFRIELFGSKGTELDTVSAYFDGALKAGDDMRAGAEIERYLCFLYDGDGDYYIEFDNRDQKYEVKIPIEK